MQVPGIALGIIANLYRSMDPSANLEEPLLLLQENGANPLSWTILADCLTNHDVPQVTYRIRKYMLSGDTREAWKLKDSFKDTLALEAVSAAIIAQIAITMPGLADFGNIHWTATAFAYTSLVCGLLSTYFAFYVQQTLGDLHSPEDVQEWLTTPRNNFTIRFLDTIIRRNISRGRSERAEDSGERIPSLMAAAILVAPSRLLRFSISALFVTLGIYLGSVYTAGLGTLKGKNANLGVLLFAIIVSVVAVCEVGIPLIVKRGHQITTLSVRNADERDIHLRNLEDVEPTMSVSASVTPETTDMILRALKASIRAQEESLNAQKALLRLLDQ